MKDSSNDNGKVSDSGYATNTCVSQSQRSSGSSLSRNSNRSESSGYCGGNPSTFGSSNYALPRPISQRKEHKKKKSKTTTTILGLDVTHLGTQIITARKQSDVGCYNPLGSSSDFSSLGKKSEEVARVESNDATELGEHNGDSNSTDPEGGVGTKTNPLDDTTSNTNEGFATVISLHNGLVIDTTPSLKAALGYARESWAGRSFIDFVHPKDKSTFANHLAKNIALPYGDRDPDLSGRQTSLFCSLRKHDEERSFSTGSGSDESNSINATRTLFLPFHLTMSVKHFREYTKEEMSTVMFLTITAKSVLPVYKAPEDTILSSIFSTRHDPNCILTHVDHKAVQYFGYLPQDIIGRSLFDLYHPEDLPFIKDVYETVVKMEGSPFRSKPYRFATQNGGYVVLETEWSSFVNPWREKIEFVVGHHRVLRGPANPDVFQPADECQRSLLANISEEVFKESKIIQGEIRALLDEKIQRSDDIDAYELSCRSKHLTTFVENLLQEVKPPAPVSKDPVRADDRSISEHDSVILGAISPHHEYCDSKSSTETPPSYNQLNYNEKLERFFKSKPLVSTAFGNEEENINSNGTNNDDIGKSSPNLTGMKDTTHNDSGSGENLSSGSNNHTSFGSRDDSDNARSANTMPSESFKLPTLTESLLNKHNIDMEKLMVKQHKERISEKKNNKQLKDSRPERSTTKSNGRDKERRKSRSGKRCGSRSQSRGDCKVPKLDATVKMCAALPVPTAKHNAPVMPMRVDDFSPPQAQSRPNVNIFPSGPVTVSQQQTLRISMPTQNVGLQEATRFSLFSPVVPIYYLSVPRVREDIMNSMNHPVSNQCVHNGQMQPNPYVSYVAAPLAGIIYPPLVCASAPSSMIYRPFVTPGSAPISRETSQFNSAVHHQENSSKRKRPESQATSVKAEPGSTMAMSESSKKVLSPGEHLSSCVSIDGGCSSLVDVQTTVNTKRETDTNSQFESSLEDSSDSSFYGSFLHTTSSGSSCNRDQAPALTPPETLWKPTKNEKEQYDTLRKDPPWQEDPKMTPEQMYQYQLTVKPLSEVLEADRKALKNLNQPQMVNEQLAQLYSDMKLGGFKAKLILSDVDSSSDNKSESSGDNSPMNTPEHKLASNCMNHSAMAMVYEENAPLLSP